MKINREEVQKLTLKTNILKAETQTLKIRIRTGYTQDRKRTYGKISLTTFMHDGMKRNIQLLQLKIISNPSDL